MITIKLYLTYLNSMHFSNLETVEIPILMHQVIKLLNFSFIPVMNRKIQYGGRFFKMADFANVGKFQNFGCVIRKGSSKFLKRFHFVIIYFSCYSLSCRIIICTFFGKFIKNREKSVIIRKNMKLCVTHLNFTHFL